MNKFNKTDKNILEFYAHDNINYMKTRLDGVIYKDNINNAYYQQNDMKLEVEELGNQSSMWITITEEFEFRPDKIAYGAYGDEMLYWIIMQHNNIVDPFELEMGLEIEIPNIDIISYKLDERKEMTEFKRLEKED